MTEKLGATGKFPDGKLNEDDEGELVFGVAHDKDGNVVLNFGKPVAWLAMPTALAIDLATMLIAHAKSASDNKRN